MTPPAPPSRTPPPPGTQPLTWTPFVLLGLLTFFTVVGPVAILLTLSRGARRGWPPDRPIEWWTFGICTGAVVVLMASCVLIGLLRWRRSRAEALASRGAGTPGGARR